MAFNTCEGCKDEEGELMVRRCYLALDKVSAESVL
jgi:hypothetical protein